jgi:putative hydrolase of the HAD superfamily
MLFIASSGQVGTKLLIWDFDGTLAYRRGGMWAAALVEVIREADPGLPVTEAQLRPYLQSGFPWHSPHQPHPELASSDVWWRSLEPLFEWALQGVGLTPGRARQMALRVRDVYADPERWRLFDDVVPALESLSARGWAHALLSNHVPELRAIVRHLGLMPYLAGVFNSAETGYEKPHPAAYRSVLAAFGHPLKVWMIGDSYRVDIAGAGAVGVRGILVRKPDARTEWFCPGLAPVVRIVGGETGSSLSCA